MKKLLSAFLLVLGASTASAAPVTYVQTNSSPTLSGLTLNGSVQMSSANVTIQGVRYIFPSSGTISNYLQYTSTNTLQWVPAASAGSGGGDSLGTHIATMTVTAGQGIVTTTMTASAFNTTTTSMTVTGSGGLLMQGPIKFSADNTYDIGASGSLRPKDLYLSGNIAAASIIGTGQLQWGDNQTAGSGSFGRFRFESDGVLGVYNNALNDWNRLMFGGSTSSYPALKRTGTGLSVRLADDSAAAPLTAGSLTVTSATVTGAASGTTGAWTGVHGWTNQQASTFTYGLHVGSLTVTGSGAGQLNATEGTAPAGVASVDVLWADSTAHTFKFIPNNGSTYTVVGSSTNITAGNCAKWGNAGSLLDAGAACGSGGGGSGGGDNMGSHIASMTITGNYGFLGTSATYANISTVMTSSDVYVTFGGSLTLNGMVRISSGLITNAQPGTTGQVLTSGGVNTTPFWSTVAAGSSASILAVTTGTSAGFATVASSPTTVINFNQASFGVSLPAGATAFVNLTVAISSVSSNYTATSTDTVIMANAVDGAITVTLPTAVGIRGKMYTVKRINTGANAVTVATTSSQTMDGDTTQILNSQYTSINFLSDGGNWTLH